MSDRSSIKNNKRWVVKVGSALLTNDGEGLHRATITNLAEQIAYLRDKGIEVILVSSGSVAAGVSQLGMKARPSRVDELQAAAAVGQASLVRHYEEAFQPFSIQTAQVLLTHSDIANRERYLNARSTLLRLLELDVLTIVNENDTVATDEICFGDNDSLGSLVANLVGADLLVILTDQNGLYTADPRFNPDASLLHEASANDESLVAMATGGTSLGRGGMLTKLSAAQIASRSGASTLIANGRESQVLERLYQGEVLGTLLTASDRVPSKKQWMAGQMKIKGKVVIDDGAERVLQQSGKSLLPVGVISVVGDFMRGELISCVNQRGDEIARGLSSYSAEHARMIMGKGSESIRQLLPFAPDDELIHRDNLVLL
ncbi:MAG: glutamate 5-kinase [Arenicella sp.]|jgi:glutamate 5-kinase